MKLLRYSLAAALLVAAATAPANAQVSGLTNTIVTNIQNTYIDTSNENVQEANPAVGLQVGDTIVGLAQVNQNQTPGNPGLTKNTIYALFSETVKSFNAAGTQITFGPTDTGPRSLQSILSGLVPAADLPAGTVAAIFDVKTGTFPNDLIGQAPPAGFTGINDYLQNIAKNGVFDFAAGNKAGNPDFFQTNLGTVPVGGVQTQLVANNTFPGTVFATTALLATLSNSLQFAQNFGGLSILANNTQFNFATTGNIGQDGLAHQLVITASTENGALGAVGAAIFGSGANNAGTTDKNTFLFVPTPQVVTGVPEPSSIILLGCGVAGFFGVGLRRKKKAVAAE
jgi:hypothetical protein